MNLTEGIWDQNNWDGNDENWLLIEHCRTSKNTAPMTMDEFNKIIDQSEVDFENGRVTEAKELLKIVENWK